MSTIALLIIAGVQGQYGLADIKLSEHLRFGAPGFQRPDTTLIMREGYAVLHDNNRKVPIWVCYRLTPEYSDKSVPRAPASAWKPEPWIPAGLKAQLSDYSGSGYNRGHMAPANDMRRSQSVQNESFLLSNSVPQNPSNNSGIWNVLEGTVGGYGVKYSDVIIITGPVFDKPLPDGTVNLPPIGSNNVAVPEWLFKIVVRGSPSAGYHVLAFKMPNVPLPGQHPRQYLTTVREVESATGLNFLNALPPAVQDKIETVAAGDVWP